MEKDEKKEMDERIKELEKGVTRILYILESDHAIKEKGLVEKVNSMQSDLSELLQRERVYKAKAATWGIIGGAIVTAIVWFVKILIPKILI